MPIASVRMGARAKSGRISFLNGTAVRGAPNIGNVPTAWSIVATGDFNGDGIADIVWRDIAGNLAIWLMNGSTITQAAGLGNVPTAWIVAEPIQKFASAHKGP